MLTIHGFFLAFVMLARYSGIHCFPIEINSSKYTLCDVLIVRPIYNHYINAFANLNNILVDTIKGQQSTAGTKLTWVILDVSQSIPEIIYEHGKRLSYAPAVTHSYVTRKSSQTRSCSILLTTSQHMETRRASLEPAEDIYATIWNLWIQKACQNKFGLIHFTSRHVTLAVHGLDAERSVALSGSSTLLRSPFLTYLVFVGENSNIYHIFDICSGSCSLTATLYKKINMFSGLLGKLIKSITPFVTTVPIYIVNFVGFARPKHECSSTKDYLREYNTKIQCAAPSIAPVVEMVDKLNGSLIYGASVDYSRPVQYIHGIIDVRSLIHFTIVEIDLNIGVVVLDDRFAKVFAYCKSQVTYESSNIITTLFAALHHEVWYAFMASLLVVYIYLKFKKFQAQGTRLRSLGNPAFEVFRWLFQGCSLNPDSVCVCVVTCCFFIEFVYLSKTTEKIIVPVKPYQEKTLSELLVKGWKVMLPLLKDGKYAPKIFKDEFRRSMGYELRIEGSKLNLTYSSSIWSKEIYQHGFVSIEEAVKYWATYFIKYGVRFESTQSLSNYKTTSLEYQVGEVIKKEDARCEIIPKQYENVFRHYHIYARNRWEIYEILMRLLYDSGVRMFWLQLHDSGVQRAKATSKPYDITAIKLNDQRTLAVFGIVCAGLAISLGGYLYEKNMYHRNVFSQSERRRKDYCKKFVLTFVQTKRYINIKFWIKNIFRWRGVGGRVEIYSLISCKHKLCASFKQCSRSV